MGINKEEMSEKTARSYRADVIDDNFSIHLNIKWLFQILCLVAGISYYGVHMENRISRLEVELVSADTTIKDLLERHTMEEESKRQELEEKISFYEKELKINLNPMSWKKRKK
ncbi:hypothetical protein N9X04_00160 [bacterium]|nr:hypothetical protein [bacterium]